MRAPLFVIVLAACSHPIERIQQAPTVELVHPASDVAVQPDSEIVIGLVADMGPQLDIAQQLADQLALRVPDVVISRSGAGALRLDDPVGYGFVRLRWEPPAVIIEGIGARRASVDLIRLQDDAAFAIVRVRRNSLVLDVLGADGVRRY